MNPFSKSRTRREALADVVRLAGGLLTGRSLFSKWAAASPGEYNPILSVEIYIWIQHFQKEKKSFAEGIEEALAAIRRAGYSRVELSADFFRPDARARTFDALKKSSLNMPTMYANSTLHAAAAAEKSVADILAVADVAKPTGLRWIVTNPLPKGGRKTDEELALQCRYLDTLGTELRKRDVGLMVHHHTPELVDNAREWRYQLAHTDPARVACCVDVDWAVRGGQPPLPFLREVGARLQSLHVRSSKDGVWMEDFGGGDINYQEVADYLKEIKFNGYLIVELAYEKGTQVTRSLEENLRLSRQHAIEIFGLKPAA